MGVDFPQLCDGNEFSVDALASGVGLLVHPVRGLGIALDLEVLAELLVANRPSLFAGAA